MASICIPIATSEQLQLLKGVGKTKASAILECRKTNPCPSLRELSEVTEIAEAVWADWESRRLISLTVTQEVCDDPANVKNLLDTFHELAIWYHESRTRVSALDEQCLSLTQAKDDLADQVMLLEEARDGLREDTRKLNKQIRKGDETIIDLQARLDELQEELKSVGQEQEHKLRREIDKVNFAWEGKVLDSKSEKEEEARKFNRLIATLQCDLDHAETMLGHERERSQQELARLREQHSQDLREQEEKYRTDLQKEKEKMKIEMELAKEKQEWE